MAPRKGVSNGRALGDAALQGGGQALGVAGGGRAVVLGGRRVARDAIEFRYRATVRRLLAA